MAVNIGEILTGTVTSITKFGAFIKLDNGDTGLCHISEVADGFVKQVEDYLKHGDKVKVKVIENNKGKISLSIKKANPKPVPKVGFEDLMNNFIKDSDEKLRTIKTKKSRRGNSHSNKS